MSLKTCADACAKSRKAGGAPTTRSPTNKTAEKSSNIVRKNSVGSRLTAPKFRLLPPDELGSVIFGCTNATINECLCKNLFGLPSGHIVYVQNIRKGMPLFLFNYTDRKLHGIYEAISDGEKNIDNTAWPSHSTGQTQYPAQVSACIRQQCNPLPENVFKHVIKDNYYTARSGQNYHIMFELDHQQTYKLIMLFLGLPSSPPTGKFPIPKAVKPLFSPGSLRDLGQNGSMPVNGLMPAPNDDSLPQEEDASRLSLCYESEQDVESCACGHTHNIEPTGNSVEDLCVPYSGLPSPSGSASSRRSSNVFLEENAPELDKKERMFRPLPKQHGSSGKEILHEQRDLDGKIGIWNDNLNGFVEETFLKQPKMDVEGPSFISCKQKDKGQSQVEKPQENRIQRIGTNASDQGSSVVTLGAEQMHHKQETEQPCYIASFEDTASYASYQSKIEHFSSSLFQMRQEGLELRQLVEAAHTEQYRELQNANTLLESLKMEMSLEVSSLKAEVAELREVVRHFSLQNNKANMMRAFETSFLPVSSSASSHKSGSDVYVLGGCNGDTWLGTVDIFFPLANEIKSAVPMPTKRPCPAASVFDNCIYVFGGGHRSSWFDIVEMYDQRKGQWATCSPMKHKRGSLTGAAVNHGIIAMGGENEGGPVSNTEWYDAYIGEWNESANMLEKRSCAAGVEHGGVVYSLGGFDGAQYLRTVERLDPRQGSWARIPPMTSHRAGLSVALLNGKIYAIGGFDGHKFLNTVEIFDPRANKWEKTDPMCSQRGHGAAAVVANTIYLIGGLHDRSGYNEFMECYREGVGWQALGPSQIGKRCYVSAVVL